jgi:hypothetical protein
LLWLELRELWILPGIEKFPGWNLRYETFPRIFLRGSIEGGSANIQRSRAFSEEGDRASGGEDYGADRAHWSSLRRAFEKWMGWSQRGGELFILLRAGSRGRLAPVDRSGFSMASI